MMIDAAKPIAVGLAGALLLAACLVGRAEDAPEPSGTSATDLGLTELTDDPTPQSLFQEVVAAAAKEDPPGVAEEGQYFSLYGPFRFPNDTTFDVTLGKDRHELFGIDISHYTNRSFPIEQLAYRNVTFLYMKATQATGLDGSFSRFWARTGNLPKGSQVHRGAYHFLTCGDPSVTPATWGRTQAQAFLKVIRANGGLRPTDMPPVVDLEWDRTSVVRDRWVGRKPGDILVVAKAFLETVERELQRKPMIYTARAWWRERMGDEALYADLDGYPVWLADYSRKSRASEKPTPIHDLPWALWQFTDSATMAGGYGPGFDANVVAGSREQFLAGLQVADFQ